MPKAVSPEWLFGHNYPFQNTSTWVISWNWPADLCAFIADLIMLIFKYLGKPGGFLEFLSFNFLLDNYVRSALAACAF